MMEVKSQSFNVYDGRTYMPELKAVGDEVPNIPPTLFRTRKPNWTEQESLHLSALVDTHHILRSRMMDANTNQQKNETWSLITSRINQTNPTVERTVEEVKRRWQNMYSTAKREASEYRRAITEAEAEGSTVPEPHQFLCSISMRLVETFGGMDNFGSCASSSFAMEGYASNPINVEAMTDMSSDTGSSTSRVHSAEYSLASTAMPLSIATTSPLEHQRPIKCEDGIAITNTAPSLPGDAANPPMMMSHAPIQRMTNNFHDAQHPYRGPMAATFSSSFRTRHRQSLNAFTQTDPLLHDERKLQYDMLLIERNILEITRERQRLRLQRDKMRLAKEEKKLELKLERRRLKNRKLTKELCRQTLDGRRKAAHDSDTERPKSQSSSCADAN